MASTPPFRAEHVGSLLRPRALKDAAVARTNGSLDERSYLDVLDREIAAAVALQRDAGLHSITDGEFGRTSWFGFFFERLEGFRLEPSQFAFRDAEGSRHSWMTCYACAPMRRNNTIAGEEFDRLKRLIGPADQPTPTATAKANLPTPAALHFFRGDDCRDPAVYPHLEQWWEDVVAIYRAEIADLAARGCTYLQFDEVPIAMLCDPDLREQIAAQGADPDHLTDLYLNKIGEVLADRPANLTVGMHLCRGNFRSRWMAAGGYEPVAERLFNEAPVDAFFLEYDSERAGDFSPLRHLPADKQVVLGLISTKTPELESVDAVARRIDEAARYVPLDRLAVSPQCGFASVAGGNSIDADTQQRKLELVVEVANHVWGTA